MTKDVHAAIAMGIATAPRPPLEVPRAGWIVLDWTRATATAVGLSAGPLTICVMRPADGATTTRHHMPHAAMGVVTVMRVEGRFGVLPAVQIGYDRREPEIGRL